METNSYWSACNISWGAVCLALSGLWKLFSISQTLPAKQPGFLLGLVQITDSMKIQPTSRWRILLACCFREKPRWALHFCFPLRRCYLGAVCPEARAQRNIHTLLKYVNMSCSCSAVLACCLPGNSWSTDEKAEVAQSNGYLPKLPKHSPCLLIEENKAAGRRNKYKQCKGMSVKKVSH